MENLFETVQRKARYGHRSYVFWRDGAGVEHFATYNRAGIKAALLAVGAKGRFTFFSPSTGTPNLARSLAYMIHLWRCAPR